jgi:ribonuclease D
LERLAIAVEAADVVPLDTEGDSLHHYFTKVCLMQISLGDDHYIVDPLAGIDLQPLLDAFAETPLIFHGADYDLRQLRSSFNFRPQRPVFDTMLAAQLAGFEQFGLNAMIEHFFGVHISKQNQKSDWSRRPLKESQLRYAVCDTLYLRTLATTLREQLRALGRESWHEEWCRRVVDAALETPNERCDDEIWRIKGVSHFSPREAAFVRDIWKWRDAEARRADIPPFKVMNNDQLLDLAEFAATRKTARDLLQVPIRAAYSRRRLNGLHQALEDAFNLTEEEWPQPIRRNGGVPFRPDRDQLQVLQTGCAEIAADLGLAPSVVAPKAALVAAMRHQPQGVDDLVEQCGLMRWQAGLVETVIGDVLGG